MIRVERVMTPSEFNRDCRRAGNRWLAANPGRRPRPLWVPFTAALAEGFQQRCGYSAVLIQNGTVDHFLSWKNRPELTYEWSNYRYADHRLNAKKQNIDDAIVDPYEVGDDWFEILLPSLQMRVTERVPAKMRKTAELTLRRLGLDHDERIVAYRAAWWRMFHRGELSLEGMHKVAPLLARAIERDGVTPDPTLFSTTRPPRRRGGTRSPASATRQRSPGATASTISRRRSSARST